MEADSRQLPEPCYKTNARVWLSPIEITEATSRTSLDLTRQDHRQYLFVHSGGGEAELDGWVAKLVPGDILFIPSRIRSHLRLRMGTRLFSFGVADDFLMSRVCATLSISLAEFSTHFNTPKKLAEWTGPAQRRDRNRVWNELSLASRRLGPYGDAAVAAYVFIMLFEKNKYESPPPKEWTGMETLTENNAPSPAAGIVLGFRSLLEVHFGEQWRISDYCKALGIRPDQLIQACKHMVGATPSTLIHERLILEAKRLLIYSIVSVTEIAYELGFSDAAYFSRFFRRQIGTSPVEFRRSRAGQGLVLQTAEYPMLLAENVARTQKFRRKIRTEQS